MRPNASFLPASPDSRRVRLRAVFDRAARAFFSIDHSDTLAAEHRAGRHDGVVSGHIGRADLHAGCFFLRWPETLDLHALGT